MATVDLSLILDRITYTSRHTDVAAIPWPDGLAPTPMTASLSADGSLPAADVIAVTWTAAEAQTLASVLTPGVASTDWVHYTKDWDKYESQLTGRSPAREAQRLGEFSMLTVGSLKVCVFHSQLHPATDGPTLPTAALAAQVATETGAKLFITTGTAGGAGDGTVLGDVNVAVSVASDFTTRLKGKPWSSETWGMAALSDGQKKMLGECGPLFAANAGRLPAEWAPRAPQVWFGETVSTDFFAFADKTDHYGLLAKYPSIRAVEMDDAAICAGLSGLPAGTAPMIASVRNASDPVMSTATRADAKLAESIYERFGGTTTISSAIATWALIAGSAAGVATRPDPTMPANSTD